MFTQPNIAMFTYTWWKLIMSWNRNINILTNDHDRKCKKLLPSQTQSGEDRNENEALKGWMKGQLDLQPLIWLGAYHQNWIFTPDKNHHWLVVTGDTIKLKVHRVCWCMKDRLTLDETRTMHWIAVDCLIVLTLMNFYFTSMAWSWIAITVVRINQGLGTIWSLQRDVWEAKQFLLTFMRKSESGDQTYGGSFWTGRVVWATNTWVVVS